MSEKVQITIILDGQGAGERKIPQAVPYGQRQKPYQEAGKEIQVTHDTEETLMSTLQKNNLISGNFCGGTGKCQRCRVQFLQAAPLPTSTERMAFSPDELRQGYRLACMVKPKNSYVIRLAFARSAEMDIVTDMIDVSEKIDFKSQVKGKPRTGTGTATGDEPGRENGAQTGAEPEASSGNNESACIIAVDLGTTTIAMQLMEIESGRVVDTYCALNPQRRFGADVLSRIQAANAGYAEVLRESVWKVLREGVDKFRCCGEMEIRCMCIAGNTTMEHLLMGLPVESLGRSPFIPVEIGLQTCTVPFAKGELPVYLAPGVSAFVGGDIAAGLYYCHLLDSLQTLCEETDDIETDHIGHTAVFIDLGTNGEMAITDGSRMIVTATAAGPAFEGGAGVSVHGSDMIAITASLLAQDIIEETGLLREPYFETGITVSVPGREETVYLTQKHIRDLQMAKAAVRAGVEILHEKMGCPEISQVYLAGGFGYYLDVEAAVAIGLLPERVQGVTKAAGNTSLAGAFAIGKDLSAHCLTKETLERKLACVESINLAAQEGFEERYLQYLNFPPKKYN